jgi:ketosteroid isomerase-like protein
MSQNKERINKFYTAFQKKDYKTMQDCYANNATFSDPVFENLNAAEVRAMWQMLITRATDLALEFKNVAADETSGSAEWTLTIHFPQQAKK